MEFDRAEADSDNRVEPVRHEPANFPDLTSSETERQSSPAADLRRYETLLAMADVVVQHRDLPGLFREMAARLHGLVPFDVSNFFLHDPQKNVMQIHVWEGDQAVGA